MFGASLGRSIVPNSTTVVACPTPPFIAARIGFPMLVGPLLTSVLVAWPNVGVTESVKPEKQTCGAVGLLKSRER